MVTSFRRGVTLMETVIGSLLVGGVLASTMHIVAPTARTTGLADRRVTANALADAMLDEIAAHPFQDPTNPTSTNGPESGEVTGSRIAFDDVDDYHGWKAPPRHPDGSAISGLASGWTISVSVHHVLASNPSSVQGTATGVKRVVVSVTLNGVLMAERSMLRTKAFDDYGRGS